MSSSSSSSSLSADVAVIDMPVDHDADGVLPPADQSVIPTRLVHCSVILPFPSNSSSWPMRPVITHPTLMWLGAQRWFYFFAQVNILLALALTMTGATFGGRVAQLTVHCTLQLSGLGWLVVSLTQMDRVLMRRLLLSFEWWWLVGNLLVLVVCSLVENSSALYFVGFLMLIQAVVWILSLDALVGFEAGRSPGQIRWVRAGLLLGMFVAVVLMLITAYSDGVREKGSTTVCLGSLCTKVVSLHQSAAMTLTVFVGKLLLQVVFRPGQPLILQSRLHICLRQQAAVDAGGDVLPNAAAAEGADSAHSRELIAHSSNLPLREPLLKQEEDSSAV